MTTFRALSLILMTMLAMVAAPSRSEAATGPEIDADVNAALTSFESQIRGARELASKAAGVLVFPSVVKAGIGLGGEYGEGLLIIRGRPGGYYNLISGSFGFQLGVEPHPDTQIDEVRISRMARSAPTTSCATAASVRRCCSTRAR